MRGVAQAPMSRRSPHSQVHLYPPARRRIGKEGKEMFTPESHGSHAERSHVRAPQSAFMVWIRLIGILRWLTVAIVAAGLGVAAHGQQYYLVDCSGANPNDFPTISSALTVAGPGSIVLVTGTCTENVTINSGFNLNIGAWYGQTANVVGNISVNNSDSVFLYGLNVTNPSGDSFDANNSHAVILDSCTGNGSLSYGLSAGGGSDVTVDGPASFDNNGSEGINMSSNAIVTIAPWNGPIDISNNRGPGVWGTAGSVLWIFGSTTIENNAGPGGASTLVPFGISLFGASKAQIGTCSGPNVIQGNQAGGINLQENSEISLWSCGLPYQTLVQANGVVGISAGLGSQVTLYEDAQILGNTGPGVEIWGNSQLNVFGTNLISGNGAAGDPRSAGIVVDGNSEAYLRGGTISSNEGPGMLVLVNSSADFTGATFTGNSGGIINCDSSAYMVSDLSATAGNPGAGINCRTPHSLGNRRLTWSTRPAIPDFSAQKKKHAWYESMATPKH